MRKLWAKSAFVQRWTCARSLAARAAQLQQTIAQALSYALYMQARDLVLAATQSSSSVNAAIALVKESQELIERFEINFAGRIRGKRCIVSFPGKYMAEWTALVQTWEEGIA